jgi:hypothetical protein
LNSGQLFSDHFLTEGIRTTAAYQRITDTAIHELCVRDEALSPMAYLVENLPIAAPSEQRQDRATVIVCSLVESHSTAATTRAVLTDWYRAEHGIERLSRALGDPLRLDADAFLAELKRARGARRPLTPAGVAAVREAWSETVAPIRERLREAELLERDLSDLVNAAYGLTPEEVQLMWETAPPRMPLAACHASAGHDLPQAV